MCPTRRERAAPFLIVTRSDAPFGPRALPAPEMVTPFSREVCFFDDQWTRGVSRAKRSYGREAPRASPSVHEPGEAPKSAIATPATRTDTRRVSGGPGKPKMPRVRADNARRAAEPRSAASCLLREPQEGPRPSGTRLEVRTSPVRWDGERGRRDFLGARVSSAKAGVRGRPAKTRASQPKRAAARVRIPLVRRRRCDAAAANGSDGSVVGLRPDANQAAMARRPRSRRWLRRNAPRFNARRHFRGKSRSVFPRSRPRESQTCASGAVPAPVIVGRRSRGRSSRRFRVGRAAARKPMESGRTARRDEFVGAGLAPSEKI